MYVCVYIYVRVCAHARINQILHESLSLYVYSQLSQTH